MLLHGGNAAEHDDHADDAPPFRRRIEIAVAHRGDRHEHPPHRVAAGRDVGVGFRFLLGLNQRPKLGQCVLGVISLHRYRVFFLLLVGQDRAQTGSGVTVGVSVDAG